MEQHACLGDTPVRSSLSAKVPSAVSLRISVGLRVPRLVTLACSCAAVWSCT